MTVVVVALAGLGACLRLAGAAGLLTSSLHPAPTIHLLKVDTAIAMESPLMHLMQRQTAAMVDGAVVMTMSSETR